MEWRQPRQERAKRQEQVVGKPGKIAAIEWVDEDFRKVFTIVPKLFTMGCETF